jgi:DNA-binding PadR family transcriptional regulator
VKHLSGGRKLLIIDQELAEEIGLNEAITLSQLNYWIEKSGKEINGKKWIYKTVDHWNEQDFTFWSKKTIQRTLTKLENEGWIFSDNFNQYGFDKTKWYALNEEKIENLLGIYRHKEPRTKGSRQFVPMEEDILSLPIPEITTDIKESNITITELQETPVKKEQKECADAQAFFITNFLSEIEEIRTEHKINEKYTIVKSVVSIALQHYLKNHSTVVQITTKDFLQGIVSREFRPFPEFSINKRTDKTSFMKIFISYLKTFERFPTEAEMKWIQEARKSAKKPFSPSEIEVGLALAVKDEYTDGFVDAFKTYLWNGRGTYVQVKERTSTAKKITIVDQFTTDDFL